MDVITATKRTRCPRCNGTIGPGARIAKAYDLKAFVHLRCLRRPRHDEVDGQGLAAGFTVGFTGSREQLGPQAQRLMRRWLEGLSAEAYVTGACTGVDALAGQHLALKHPRAQHVVCVPDRRDRVEPWWPSLEATRRVEVLEMPEGSSYAERNEAIVALADHLVAFVAHPEDDPRSQRSGTWQTVWMARREHLPVTFMDLAAPTTWTHTPAPRPRQHEPEGLF